MEQEMNSIKVREDLNINLKRWSAKTKKKFMDLFRKNGMNISKKHIYDTLISPYIEPNDIFINSEEYEYILIELKKYNFDDNLEFEMKCNACKQPVSIDTTLSDITYYNPSSLTSIKEDFIKFRNLPSQEVFQAVVEKFPDENKAYLQLLMSIESLNGVQSESISQVMEDIENLDINKYNKIEKLFVENSSFIQLLLNIECPHCNDNEDYEFDSIPGFFEDMLPKNAKI